MQPWRFLYQFGAHGKIKLGEDLTWFDQMEMQPFDQAQERNFLMKTQVCTLNLLQARY